MKKKKQFPDYSYFGIHLACVVKENKNLSHDQFPLTDFWFVNCTCWQAPQASSRHYLYTQTIKTCSRVGWGV